MVRTERTIVDARSSEVRFSEIPQKFALTFPGQGSEFIGMGKSILDDREVARIYDQADRISQYPIKQISVEDTGYLKQEVFARPAIFVHNHACFALLKRNKGFKPEVVTGRGVGFYNALVAAGSITFKEGLELVQAEAEGIDQASELHPGKMVTLSFNGRKGKDFLQQTVRELMGKDFFIEAFNSENQVVVGAEEGRFSENQDFIRGLEHHGVKVEIHRGKAVIHSPLMESAKKCVEDVLKSMDVRPAQISVATTTTPPRFIRTAGEIKKEILDQITNSIQWIDVLKLIGEERIPVEVGTRAFLSDMAGKNMTKAVAGVLIGGSFAALAFIAYKKRNG